MDDAQRWSVTYTNHVKQKRKVYHDGFLVLQSSCHKVMLYDECDKLLETRFVKKDDVIKAGETVTFDSYLIDIGELCGGHQPKSILNCQEKDKKVSDKSGSSYSFQSQNRRPMFGKSKGRVINLSPSHKMIRDFKRSEMNKFGSSPNCTDMTEPSTREWQVLYTAQITQKAKKFHDGFLELIVHGPQGRQVKLYDANRRHLDSRFLKKDETVCSGESLAFEGHLVELGEEEGDHKPLTDITPQSKIGKVVGKTDLADHQAKIPTNKIFPAGKTPDNTSHGKFTNLNDSSSKTESAKSSWRNAEPRRAVHDILSILRQPIERKVVPMKKPMTEDHLGLHSSNSQSNTEIHVQKYAGECTRTEEFREKTSDHDSRIKVLKSETAEVVIAAGECTVSENGRDSEPRPSSFCPRSETINCTAPSPNVECSGQNELMLNSSSVESHMLVTAGSNCDERTPIASASPTRSNENEEPENPPEICAREEIMTETIAAATNDLTSSKLPKLWEDQNCSSSRYHEASRVHAVASNDYMSHDPSGIEEKPPKQDFHAKETDEFPSFDLGF